MHGLPKISAIKMKEFLHARVDEFAEELVESLNQAQPGRLIADSEEVVRKLIHEFGQAAYQAALQQKVDAAEAAFSPSGGNSDGPSHGPSGEQAVAQQRSATQQRAHNQRTDPLAKTLVAFADQRQLGSGGSVDRLGTAHSQSGSAGDGLSVE